MSNLYLYHKLVVKYDLAVKKKKRTQIGNNVYSMPTEIFKTLLREIRNLNKWTDTPC